MASHCFTFPMPLKLLTARVPVWYTGRNFLLTSTPTSLFTLY